MQNANKTTRSKPNHSEVVEEAQATQMESAFDAGRKRRIFSVTNILLALAFMVLLFGITISFFPQSPINVLGIRFFLLTNTRSMEPDMHFNDLIIIRQVLFESLEVGDVVTFTSNANINGTVREIFITHQIIEIIYSEEGERFLRTQGTNPQVQADRLLVSVDGANNTNRYVGKLWIHTRFLGLMFAYLRSPFGLTMIALNVAAAVAVWILLKPPKEYPEQESVSEEIVLDTIEINKNTIYKNDIYAKTFGMQEFLSKRSLSTDNQNSKGSMALIKN